MCGVYNLEIHKTVSCVLLNPLLLQKKNVKFVGSKLSCFTSIAVILNNKKLLRHVHT